MRSKSMSVSRSRSRGRSSVRTPSRSRSLPPTPRATARKRSRSKSSASSSVVKLLKQLKGNPKKGIDRSVDVTRYGKQFLAKYKTRAVKTRKFDLLGASLKTERSGTKTDADIVYLGHANMPHQHTLDAIFLAIVKKLFAKIEVLPYGLDANIPYITGTDSIEIHLKTNPSAATVANVFLISATGSTVQAIASYLGQVYKNPTLTNSQLQEIRYVPSSTSVLPLSRINLQNAKMSVKATSVMKLQNISLGKGGAIDGEAVNAIALSGRYYRGRGVGTMLVDSRQQNPPFMADENGYISAAGIASSSLQEPPPGYSFQDVRMESGVGMNPGEIKTSFLKDQFVINLNNLWKKLLCVPDDTYNLIKTGQFALLGLEKMVDDSASDELVRVQYDIQNNIHMYLIGGYDTLTLPAVVETNL